MEGADEHKPQGRPHRGAMMRERVRKHDDAHFPLQGRGRRATKSPRINLREENARLREALDRVLIGGNHLGLLIGVDHPPYGVDNHEVALTHYGAGWQYEVWCCWNAIMLARTALTSAERDGG